MGIESIRYDGRHALVVGGATGMGAATAQLLRELGARVSVADVQPVPYPVDAAFRLDLRDTTAIDALIDALPGPVHALFACAGVSGDPFSGIDVMKINFIGQRRLIERAIGHGLLGSGAAIAAIASIGGFGWDRRLALIREFLANADPAAAVDWLQAHPECANYTFSKQAFITYCKYRAVELGRLGIRINATGPGPTLTPLMDSTPTWGSFMDNEFGRQTGRAGTSSLEQAWPLVFLNSAAASAVSGQVLFVDCGYSGAGEAGGIDSSLVNALAPRLS